MIASCSFVEEKFRDCSERDGIGLATMCAHENLAVGSKRESEKEDVRCDVLICQKESPSEELHEDCCEEVAEDGLGPCESVGKTSS